MSRELYGPRPSLTGRVQPLVKGGTGTDNLAAAPASIGLLDNTKKGVDNGVLGLDGSGKLPNSAFPASLGINQINITGEFNVVIGTSNTFQITDYDSFRVYTATASAGSVSISGDTVTYVAPASAQAVTMILNGRSFDLTVVTPRPQKPVISAPVNGSTGQAVTGLAVTASAFVEVGDSATHQSSDWQIATDAAFTAIAASSIGDTANKTTWTVGSLALNTLYYMRVRYRATNGNYSDYSSTVSFTTKPTVNPSVEEAKLVEADKRINNMFGYVVALASDGSRLVVGCPGKPGGTGNNISVAGAVYVFMKTGSTWTQEALIKSASEADNNRFGTEVSIDSAGTRIAISQMSENGNSIGAVSIYLRTGSTWALEQKFSASTAIVGDSFGAVHEITPDGTRLVVGRPGRSAYQGGGGDVFVFLRTGVTWTEEVKIDNPSPVQNDTFGGAVAITADGAYILVGRPGSPSSSSTVPGATVRGYKRTGVTWSMIDNLPVTGSEFGASTVITPDGTRCIIGAPNGSGVLYVFRRNVQGFWVQEAAINNPSGGTGVFGYAHTTCISANGDRISIGSRTATVSGKANAGSVLSYLRNTSNNTWSLENTIVASDSVAGGLFGMAVAISSDGDRVAVGTTQATVGGTAQAGAVYVYR